MKFTLVGLATARVELHGNCVRHDDCESGLCSLRNNNICMEKRENNQVCVSNEDCVSGRCSQRNGSICLPQLPKGTGCFENEDCLESEGLFCAWQDGGVCNTKLGRGGNCLLNDDCITGWCSSTHLMKCREKLGLQELCADSDQCESGWCSISDGASCMAKKEDGIGCVLNRECQSGYCSWGFSGLNCASLDEAMMAFSESGVFGGDQAFVDSPFVESSVSACAAPPASEPVNGTVTRCRVENNGDNVTDCEYVCVAGFQYADSNNKTWACNESSGWDARPECIPAPQTLEAQLPFLSSRKHDDCLAGPATKPIHGSWKACSASGRYVDFCQVACHPGYVLGNTKHECTSTGWGVMPICEPLEVTNAPVVDQVAGCRRPPQGNPRNGLVTRCRVGHHSHRTIQDCEIECDTGYVAAEGSLWTCSNVGWGDAPSCVKVSDDNNQAPLLATHPCEFLPDAPVENGNLVCGYEGTYEFFSVCDVVCHSGYSTSNKRLRCTNDGWDAIPQCSADDRRLDINA